MAPPLLLRSNTLLLLALHLLLFLLASSAPHLGVVRSETRIGSVARFPGRMLLLKQLDDDDNLQDEEPIVPKKKKSPPTSIAKSTSSSAKNQTTKPPTDKAKVVGLSGKNQTTKLLKPSSSGLLAKNQTKAMKPTNSTKTAKPGGIGTELKKLNSTSSSSKLKKLNITSNSKSSDSIKISSSTKISSTSLEKKSLDLIKLGNSPKNKTAKPSHDSETKKTPKKADETEDKGAEEKAKAAQEKQNPNPKPKPKPKPKQKQPSWVDQDEDDDLVSEFRDLPTKFQQSVIPDIERISTTSNAYITKARNQMTKGFKPYVGNKYAPTIASVVSCAFILIPLVLVSLIFNRIKAYFSLQKLLIFIQIYLSIYFTILCFSSLATGLEPLRFFYATSPSTYVGIQVMQTLGYVVYLLMLLMYLVLVFSTDCGFGPKFLGLAQTFVGYAIGLHYYMAVFHRMVLHQPPKTNWKVHGIYAACFLAISVFAQAERRKKAYLEDGGEEGKKS